MSNRVVAKEKIRAGTPVVIQASSVSGRHAVVFEDDGDVGYFYAVDPLAQTDAIQDALHIYDVRSLAENHETSIVEIVWSADDRRAVLLINDFAHAVFDFVAKQGYCRTGLPQPIGSGAWSAGGHGWDDNALALLQ